MFDFLALKRLSASDLTFFERLFRTVDAGNQKSINLNADVLTGELYPSLSAVSAAQPDGEIGFPLTIYGPAAAAAYRVRRKIVKGGAYKNWRLNGEFVYDPPGQPGRFDDLRPGDLAVFGFQGRLSPHAVSLVLLAASVADDAALHAALAPLVAQSRRSMASMSPEALSEALRRAGAGAGHPLSGLTADAEVVQALEDAALGGASGPEVLRKRRRRVSREDLMKAKASADRNGVLGEELIDAWLSCLTGVDYEWVSASDALSPFDFVRRERESEQSIDVKSTSGGFENDFHLSLPEVKEAARSKRPYLIYRVYSLTEEGGTLRVSVDMRPLCARLLDAHEAAMFSGIKADSFSVPVSVVSWGDPIQIDVQDDDGEDG